ncbi:MAG: PD-(D/E)XK nuclease family protein [bacterium]
MQQATALQMKTQNKTVSVSASTLNILADCPRCFWLHFHGIPRPRGAFPSLPGGMDLIIKEYCDRYRAEGRLPPLLEGKLPGKLSDISFRNMSYEHPEMGIRVTGKLDECLELPEQVFAPLDHKTRGSAPEELHSAYFLQASVYSSLLKWNGHAISDRAYFAYYFPVKGAELHNGFAFEVRILACRVDLAYVENMLRSAKDMLAMPGPPPPLSNCEYCQYALNASAGAGGT